MTDDPKIAAQNLMEFANSALANQRAKDIKAISIHFGIPVKDIEKVLQAKEFTDD